MSRLGPISPKAHGAWLGAGTGSYIASQVIALLQQYVTHTPIPTAAQGLIYGVLPTLLAFAVAYILPAIPASLVQQAKIEALKGGNWPIQGGGSSP